MNEFTFNFDLFSELRYSLKLSAQRIFTIDQILNWNFKFFAQKVELGSQKHFVFPRLSVSGRTNFSPPEVLNRTLAF